EGLTDAGTLGSSAEPAKRRRVRRSIDGYADARAVVDGSHPRSSHASRSRTRTVGWIVDGGAVGTGALVRTTTSSARAGPWRDVGCPRRTREATAPVGRQGK